MKKIINGKKYDTETAREVGSYEMRDHEGDLVTEALYRKENGEFFSHYYVSAHPEAGSLCFLTEERARNFLETHGTVEQYEAVFGEVEE